MPLNTTAFIVQVITFIFAYIVSVTITGALTAWITNKMGDSTGKDFGYMTLNPFVHINLFGLLFIVWARVGFGNRVPVDPYNIREPHRRLKMGLAYYADAIACVVLAFISLFTLVVLFGPGMPDMIKTLLYRCSSDLSHLELAQSCPSFSSARITAIFVLLATAYLNVVLGVVRLIINSFYLYLDTRSRGAHDMTQNYYMTFIAPFILLLLFGSPLIVLTVETLTAVAQVLAHLLF